MLTPSVPAPGRLAGLQRLALVLVQCSLVLPLVTVRGCGGGSPRTLSGVEHYFLTDALPLGLLLAFAAVMLFAFPWRGDRSAHGVAALGLRGWTASVAGAVALVSPAAMHLDTRTAHIGYALHTSGWGLIYLGYLGLTAHLARALPQPMGDRPVAPGWAVVGLVVGPPVAAALGFMAHARSVSPTTPTEALTLLGLSWALTVPLALGGLGLVRARQSGAATTRVEAVWWAAVAVTLVSVLGALLDG